MIKIYDLKTEYQRNPIGIDLQKPCFSWKLESGQKATIQKNYRIIVSVEGKSIWDTGEVRSEQSIHIEYKGENFLPRTRYDVKVIVTDNNGNSAGDTAWFETGLLSYENFTANWITHGFEDDLQPPAVFVKSFKVSKAVKKARLYASALGIYEFTLNGKDGSDVRFAPGWTCYQQTIQYQTYDITDLVQQENEIKFIVGNGWYKGVFGFFNQGDHYGKRTALIAQLEITYVDDTVETIITDGSWINTTEEHRYGEIYHGEIIDFTQTQNEKTLAKLYEHTKDVLIAQLNTPVKITERIAGKSLIITPKNEVVIDFGQNISGVVEFKIKQERGTKITLRHAEALDENNNFYTVNLRTAKATDTFVCSGNEDYFRPKFTFHGFRYISVDGLGEQLNPEDFTACVMHTDLEKTGNFECSNEAVNRLMQNIDWGLRDNFLDIPTDCPQRDERLGYTGDAQIFLPTATVIRDVALFFKKWLKDIRYEQSLGNGVPTTVPNILGQGGAIAIWHDAATIIPWVLYQNYGDVRFLEEQFDSMKECVEYSKKLASEDGLIKSGQQLGDWVSMDVPRGPWLKRDEGVWNLELIEKSGSTDPYFIANVYYAHSTYLTAEAAKILGKSDDQKKYHKLYDEIIHNIRNEYITKNGRVISNTQTACLFALHFNIAENKDRKKILSSLLNNLKQHKNHLTTGFAGTPFLCPTLSEYGLHDIAGTVFLKDDCPSWLYHVKLGATTMWELWDGVNPDGSFNKFEMNSLNHYSYGSIGGWVYHNLLGLSMLEPGYKKSKIAPRMIKGIPDMKGYIETVYGTLACDISCHNNKYVIDITIPANTTAVVCLPEKEDEVLGSGRYHFEYDTESSFVKERYDMDSKFKELLENPIGASLLGQHAKELLENEMFMMFAKERSLSEISNMLPPEAGQLIEIVLQQCNANSV